MFETAGVTAYPAGIAVGVGQQAVGLVGGLVQLANPISTGYHVYHNYNQYRAAGLTMFSAGFYATPILGGIGQMGSQAVTGRSHAAHNFGRSLSGMQWATSAAYGVSILGAGAAGAAHRLGINPTLGHVSLPRSVAQFGQAMTISAAALRFGSGPAKVSGVAAYAAWAHRATRTSISRPQFRTWNKFQAGTRGQFATRAEAGQAWAAYRDANGIATGAARNTTVRRQFLRSLANKGIHGSTPRWMNQWLRQGRVPPGYQVDHIRPLSIGGADMALNMRLQSIDIHHNHHYHYAPWRNPA